MNSPDSRAADEIDEIVEFGGGIAEVGVTRGPMADHAVGGVDRLVGNKAGKPQQHEPEHRRDDAVGKVLGGRFDRGAGDASLIKAVGIAADDHRDGLAASGKPAGRQRIGDSAPRGRRGCSGQSASAATTASRTNPKGIAGDRAWMPRPTPVATPTMTAMAGSRRGGEWCARRNRRIEAAIEPADQRAEYRHRMWQPPPQPVGIADHRVEREGERHYGEMSVDLRHGARAVFPGFYCSTPRRLATFLLTSGEKVAKGRKRGPCGASANPILAPNVLCPNFLAQPGRPFVPVAAPGTNGPVHTILPHPPSGPFSPGRTCWSRKFRVLQSRAIGWTSD